MSAALELADRMRYSGCPDSRKLREVAEAEDYESAHFRHACYHAGILTPADGILERFSFCPVCGERLDWPEDG